MATDTPSAPQPEGPKTAARTRPPAAAAEGIRKHVVGEHRAVFEPLARWQRIIVFVSLGLIALVADQVTKEMVARGVPEGRQTVAILDGYLWLSHVYNPGIAWGMFAEHPSWVAGVAVLTVAIVIIAATCGRFSWPVYIIGLALVVGGALGNLFDRLVRPRGVLDFIDVDWWPQFNLADAEVVVGAILVGYAILRASRIEERLIEAKLAELTAPPDDGAAALDSVSQGDQ